MNEIPPNVQAALDHVRSFFPEVVLVVFDALGNWRYMDEDMCVVPFTGKGDEIDQEILEAASNEMGSLGLPAVFQVEEEN